MISLAQLPGIFHLCCLAGKTENNLIDDGVFPMAQLPFLERTFHIGEKGVKQNGEGLSPAPEIYGRALFGRLKSGEKCYLFRTFSHHTSLS